MLRIFGFLLEEQYVEETTVTRLYGDNVRKREVGTGLITGSETTVNGVTVKDLKPTGTATRGQVAAIIQRFCEGNNL